MSGQGPWALVPVVVATALAGVLAGSRVHVAFSQTALRFALASLTAVLALTVWVRLLVAG